LSRLCKHRKLIWRNSPGHRHYRNFDLLLTMISSRLMAGKKDPRDDRPNPVHRTYDRRSPG
jgi:hypothetical protein